ncbi:hypothetical protein CPB83DRAFT_356550 [Crepidotus variabilis]|uniref:Thioredoxin domain-containing protein n=1 Tax=Crepidotus variabilis TaxID=179855 RepID=A0A9P6EFK8_9AGAR|nr:hypothetical protein CPB83DRAFT_356550 [Crepidotus variabilis]
MPTYTVLHLEEFRRQLQGTKKIVAIFHGKWDGHSKRNVETFRALAEQERYQKFYTFFELETDEHPEVFSYYQNKIIPHVVIFQGQKRLDELIGVKVDAPSMRMLNEHRFT